MDFRGFDASRVLILRGGIPRPAEQIPESLSQSTLAGRFLVGRLGVLRRWWTLCVYIYIYIYIVCVCVCVYVCIYIYIKQYIYIYIIVSWYITLCIIYVSEYHWLLWALTQSGSSMFKGAEFPGPWGMWYTWR